MINESEPGRLQICLLGEFLFLANDKPVAGLHTDRPQSLLAYLLLHRQAPQSRQHLAFLMWPDSTESQARTNLRNLLHTLRRVLPDAGTFLITDATTVQWHSDITYDLDVAHFEAALHKAKKSDNEKIIQDCLETAVSLYQGDLLPGNYDDWLIPIREELRQQYLEALRALVALLEGKGEYRLAARYCRRLLQLDPFDEVAAVQLMYLHALSGDRASVRRSYQTLTKALQRELGVAPASATQEAYVHLLHMETKQPLKTVPVVPTGVVSTAVILPEWRPRPLPVPPTPFIGRETPLAEIAQCLADPDCRLLTIVGLGGIGKTRLALQTAVGHQAVFSDGVAYVSLAPLKSADLLVATIADVLKFTFSGAADPHDVQLCTFLSQKEMLLVLDNFEQLLSSADKSNANGGENWVAELLQCAPGLKLLVTSRQRLDLQEEWLYELQGMVLPEGDDETTLINNGSVALFLQSARRVDSHFALSPENLEHVVKICHLVGGMPLGIELAASWVRLLSCAEIAGEIERSLSFLTTGIRNVPSRHRSIHAVFDHSWNLLSATEQQVLSRLSVFRSGFSREAAEQVGGADLATLSALVNKSLLQRTDRFHLHELVRQYAATRLHEVPTDEEETIRRHWMNSIDFEGSILENAVFTGSERVR